MNHRGVIEGHHGDVLVVFFGHRRTICFVGGLPEKLGEHNTIWMPAIEPAGHGVHAVDSTREPGFLATIEVSPRS